MQTGSEMIALDIKKHFQLRAIEWWGAGVMTCWGFFVLLFPAMFQSNVLFSGMLKLAPQNVWGLAAMMLGLSRIMALTINGFWIRTPIIRWFTAMTGVFLWFSVSAGMFYAPQVSTGLVIYGWLMLADIYSAYRSASDFMETELHRRLKEQGGVGNVSRIHSSK